MNVSGVTATMPSFDQYSLPSPAAAPEVASSDLVNVSVAASIQVMDMAQNVFEDAAARLIESMAAAMTGVGQNVDITV